MVFKLPNVMSSNSHLRLLVEEFLNQIFSDRLNFLFEGQFRVLDVLICVMDIVPFERGLTTEHLV